MIGAGVRDSCGKSVSKGEPAGAKSAEEASGPPAESECLEWKSKKQIRFIAKYTNQVPYQTRKSLACHLSEIPINLL
ncbi:hypothetical protein FC678_13750 [Peribacillus simplex]|uniref:Uncharacterized protein n=1 Tax=Peribacillus simplex TaxID=1478 RepID=A0A9X8ZGF9_9BACI|nr:hypothetical protein FC678_13750 [Peribacillus simplex]